jgi:hypothetical protein
MNVVDLHLGINKFFSPFPSENGILVYLKIFYSLCCMLSPSLGITKEIMSRGPHVLDMEC